MRAGARRALEPVLVAACLVLANLVSSRLYLRADLSEGGLYSLSQGSRRILAALPGPVEIRAYFSKDLPDYSQLQDYEPAVMTRASGNNSATP